MDLVSKDLRMMTEVFTLRGWSKGGRQRRKSRSLWLSLLPLSFLAVGVREVRLQADVSCKRPLVGIDKERLSHG